MNKKFLIIAMAVFIWGGALNVCQAESVPGPLPEEHGFIHPHGEMMKGHRPPSPEEFEKRLNLTEEQKQIAKTQREKSIEKIKPIIEQIKSKKAEIEMIQMSRMAQQAIDEKVAELQGEIRALRKQAHEIRKENMKAFEASLSEAQRKELQKMKEEGRKRFEQEHKKSMAQ